MFVRVIVLYYLCYTLGYVVLIVLCIILTQYIVQNALIDIFVAFFTTIHKKLFLSC